MAAITSGGAIPDTGNYMVVAEPDGKTVGTVDEDFAVESLAGDVFLLGTTSWRIKRVEPGRVRVEDAKGAPPNIPFWNGEAPGRTFELSEAVSNVREQIASHEPEATIFLIEQCGLDEAGAKQAIAYVTAGAAMLNALPTQKTVVAERFFDEGGGMQLIIHAPFGSRINRAWGLALRKRFCRSFNFELQAAATDNGINISLTEQHAFPLELVFEFLKPQSVEHVLTQAMLDAPMFTARWRWNASRALAILRFNGGRKVPPPIQRMRAEDLLASVFPDQVACAENLTGEIRIPDHPLVNETIDNCLHEAMDLDGLQRILEDMESGAIRKVAIDNAEPSPFSHEILNANPYAYLDDAPLEERRARAVQLRRTLRTDLSGGAGILDPAAIATVAAESWPDVRDADELHDALLTLIRLPADEPWQPWFNELAAAGRAHQFEKFWVATERLHLKDEPLPIVRGWMDSRRADHRHRARRTPGTPARRRRAGSAAARIRRPGHARPLQQRVRVRRNRVVQPPHSGAHPSPDPGPAPPRNRTGHRCSIPAFPPPLAARRPRQPPPRCRWHAPNHSPVAGLRNLRRGLGAGRARAPRRIITSRNFSTSSASPAR